MKEENRTESGNLEDQAKEVKTEDLVPEKLKQNTEGVKETKAEHEQNEKADPEQNAE